MHVIPVRVLVKEVCSFPLDGGDVVFATPLSFAQAAAVDCVHVISPCEQSSDDAIRSWRALLWSLLAFIVPHPYMKQKLCLG